MDRDGEIILNGLLATYAEVEAKAKDANQALDMIKQAVIDMMEAEQIKTHEVDAGGKIYRATYVQATTYPIDEKGLREELGDSLVDAYCKRVLDREKIEIGMEEGLLDPVIVGRHITERKNKPSVRFSTRAAADS